MSVAKLLYVFEHAPYSTSVGQETLDAAFIGAAFEQPVSVLFIHDGVFQLKSEQDTRSSDIKQYTKAFAALADFGIEHVYVHDLSLKARGLELDHLQIDVQLLDSDGIRSLISEQKRVFTF
ncbi:MAG: tRNA 2-thiouridine synthesizing protein C [Cryomorphaceae bacterium]|jgi:tRNA 2-thiouridine synthesizing protein C